MDTQTSQENYKHSIVIPLTQALISGLFIGILGWSISWILGYAGDVQIGLICFSCSSLFCWLMYRSKWEQRLESILGIDLNADGVIGEDESSKSSNAAVSLWIDSDHGGDRLDIPGGIDRFREFATQIIAGKSFTSRAFCGNGKIYTEGIFEDLRHSLISHGYAVWNNSNERKQGCRLTNKGMALLRGVVANNFSDK